MFRKEIIEENDRYIVEIYLDDELIIRQFTNPLTGQYIKTPEEAKEVSTILLNDIKTTDESILNEMLEKLKKITYEYISKRYDKVKKESDLLDENFYPTFLVKKKGYTFEEISNTIYDLTAIIFEGKKTFKELVNELKEKYPDNLTFGLEPFESELTLKDINEDLIIDNLNVIYPTGLIMHVNYEGNEIILKDNGQSKLVSKEDNNEVFGIVDYENGKVKLDSGKFDKDLINEIKITYRKVFIVPEWKAWEQLLKSAVRMIFAQNVKFRYHFLVQRLKNMSAIELERLDLEKLVNEYYIEIPELG